ncbi:MgtC/SapB family protein [Paenibacillus sp. HB172176]|uniref:MgtC/SapB family protein n=1 Tax=Paenibacillus sp. HB172176 TaxID=2493690 RepID=UPI00143BC19C|nr:MgtC/SapB family protein [Paenibacillus sp. HB172176]
MVALNPEVWRIDFLELSLRIVIAVIFGGIVGFERELGDHAAGFRTHILVCLGSALISLLSIYGFSEFAYEPNVRLDPSRLAAQVVSGIGFLGAGTIMRTGISVSGLTTAASLWVVAAIGLAVGAGFYYGATLATAAMLVSLFLLNKVERRFLNSSSKVSLTLEVWDDKRNVSMIFAKFRELGIQIRETHIENRERSFGGEIRSAVYMKMTVRAKTKMLDQAVAALAALPNVIRVDKTAGNSEESIHNMKVKEMNFIAEKESVKL